MLYWSDSPTPPPSPSGGRNCPKRITLIFRSPCVKAILDKLSDFQSPGSQRRLGFEHQPKEISGFFRPYSKSLTMDPSIGSRRLTTLLERDHGIKVNRKRLQRLRRKMGIETIWCRPRRTSIPDNGHRKSKGSKGSVRAYVQNVWTSRKELGISGGCRESFEWNTEKKRGRSFGL